MKHAYLSRWGALVLAMMLMLSLALSATALDEPPVPLTTYYSSAEFEAQFTYTGNDLGATWSEGSTTFRVWAPTAESVKVNLYESGTAGTDDRIDQVEMIQDVNGTWVATVEGNLNGTYYTYLVEVDGKVNEACDPYARTTGVNGLRAMVIDLASTNPEGWENDADPHAGNSITDAVIYELHVRDLSVDESSGITNKGKFLGLIETGTTNSNGIPTGLDHIKSLGITHIHLLPSYDYASVDESKPDSNQFNWGYDPLNYNVPEGSYSTDPFNGEVRVKEFKQMVKCLHDNGISVIMDVVYNHVYNADTFCFNQIVPQFFNRVSANGAVSQGSGCGNDTASERAMIKKYIVDSVKYWADEYHIDGFRFDLVGLIDTETINAVVEEVHKTHPNVIFYGEGWTMTTYPTKDGYTMTTQKNSTQTPGFSFFNDTLRDALRGPMNGDSKPGFISGGGGYGGNVKNCFLANASWCTTPTQTINYASCHDNLALFDKIQLSTRGKDFADQVKMNNLAAAVVITSQGTPFFQAGEEILRSKPLPQGGYDHNSYKSPDSINSIKWDNLNNEAYQAVRDYYAGLIAFRAAHPALRMTTAEEIAANITAINMGFENSVVAFQFAPGAAGEDNEGMFFVFNAKAKPYAITLPEGKWTVYVQDQVAGTEPLGVLEGEVEVAPLSTLIVVKEKQNNVTPPATEPMETTPSEPAGTTAPADSQQGGEENGSAWMIVGFAVGLLMVGVAVVIVIVKKKAA